MAGRRSISGDQINFQVKQLDQGKQANGLQIHASLQQTRRQQIDQQIQRQTGGKAGEHADQHLAGKQKRARAGNQQPGGAGEKNKPDCYCTGIMSLGRAVAGPGVGGRAVVATRNGRWKGGEQFKTC